MQAKTVLLFCKQKLRQSDSKPSLLPTKTAFCESQEPKHAV